MNFDKKEFLKTKLGKQIKHCIKCWDEALINEQTETDALIRSEYIKRCIWYQGQWQAYKSALKHFTGMEYDLSRNKGYFGLINMKDGSDWLFKIKR